MPTRDLAPRRHVSKTYTVVIDTPLTEEMKAGFAEGVTLADGTALSPAEVEALTPDGLTVKVRLRQGCTPNQADVRCVRRGRERPASGCHRRACAGRALPRGSGGSFPRRSDSNYHRSLTAFHLIFKKHHILPVKYSQEPRKTVLFGLKIPLKDNFNKKEKNIFG